MPAGRKRIPRNMARIEFLACREQIESLFAQGFDKRKIHTRLAESGQFTMSYDSFCKVLIRASKNELNIQSLTPPLPASASAPAPAPPLRQAPKVIKADSDQLQDPRNIDLKTVF